MEQPGPWVVFVDDNFHYMDEQEKYRLGSYGSYEAAEAVCRRVVDRSLAGLLQPGMTAEELWQQYRCFGEDPFIRGPEPSGETFSAWRYAKVRCPEVAGGPA